MNNDGYSIFFSYDFLVSSGLSDTFLILNDPVQSSPIMNVHDQSWYFFSRYNIRLVLVFSFDIPQIINIDVRAASDFSLPLATTIAGCLQCSYIICRSISCDCPLLFLSSLLDIFWRDRGVVRVSFQCFLVKYWSELSFDFSGSYVIWNTLKRGVLHAMYIPKACWKSQNLIDFLKPFSATEEYYFKKRSSNWKGLPQRFQKVRVLTEASSMWSYQIDRERKLNENVPEDTYVRERL